MYDFLGMLFLMGFIGMAAWKTEQKEYGLMVWWIGLSIMQLTMLIVRGSFK